MEKIDTNENFRNVKTPIETFTPVFLKDIIGIFQHKKIPISPIFSISTLINQSYFVDGPLELFFCNLLKFIKHKIDSLSVLNFFLLLFLLLIVVRWQLPLSLLLLWLLFCCCCCFIVAVVVVLLLLMLLLFLSLLSFSFFSLCCSKVGRKWLNFKSSLLSYPSKNKIMTKIETKYTADFFPQRSTPKEAMHFDGRLTHL